MVTHDDIENQRRMLDILRKNMQVLRDRAAHGGETPEDIVLQIKDIQRQIQETKAWLVARGEIVEDEEADGGMPVKGHITRMKRPGLLLLGCVSLLVMLVFAFLVLSFLGSPQPISLAIKEPQTSAPAPAETPSTTLPLTPLPSQTPTFQEMANRKYAELETGVSAFNSPTDMEIGQTIIVRYRLGFGTVTTSTLQAGLGSAAAPQIFTNDQVKINSLMRATLTGEKDAFDIILVGEDAERLIVADAVNEWAWQVTAKQGGPHQLTFQLVALIQVGDKDYRYPFPVEARSVTVNINWLGQTQSFISNNWQGLLVWLVPAGAAVAVLWQRIRQRKDQRPRVATTQPTPKRTAPHRQTAGVPPRVVTPEEAASVTNDDIREQYKLLKAHRGRLAVYVRQRASFGRDFVPPSVEAGIDDARADIQQVKAILQSWGETVADMPDDDEDQ